MVGTDSAESDRLFLRLEVVSKRFRAKRLVVCTVGLDFHTVSTSKVLEFVLGLEGFARSQRHLVVKPHKLGCMVDKCRATMELHGYFLLSKCVG